MNRFVPNPALEAELRAAPEMLAATVAATEPAKLIAETIAPVHKGTYTGEKKVEWHPRHYRDSFVIVVEEGQVRFGNTAWYSHFIEFGTVRLPPHAVLRRSVQLAGMRLLAAV